MDTDGGEGADLQEEKEETEGGMTTGGTFF
ncbi:hypothetical protein SBDP1_1300003 [Syntrophobacter sp. SbD1]|nr:hypothetical protein SBDP1_1300003 [Syntrophobacter sp. SbD1]